jgi:AcrR family transcriptional regulator
VIKTWLTARGYLSTGLESTAVPSITRKSSKRRTERREDIVGRMLPVVEGLLADGERYSEVSVEKLIKAAGISRSTFYVYFEDKGKLLVALAEDVMAKLVGAAQVWWSLPPDATEADLRDALWGIIAVYGEHSLVWDSLVEASSYDPFVAETFRGVVEGAAAGVAKHIRDGQAAGNVRAEADPKRTAAWLTWMTERGLYQLTPGATTAELKKLCDAQTEIVWRVLYDGSPSRG